jgi:hypothetical protein
MSVVGPPCAVGYWCLQQGPDSYWQCVDLSSYGCQEVTQKVTNLGTSEKSELVDCTLIYTSDTCLGVLNLDGSWGIYACPPAGLPTYFPNPCSFTGVSGAFECCSYGC